MYSVNFAVKRSVSREQHLYRRLSTLYELDSLVTMSCNEETESFEDIAQDILLTFIVDIGFENANRSYSE